MVHLSENAERLEFKNIHIIDEGSLCTSIQEVDGVHLFVLPSLQSNILGLRLKNIGNLIAKAISKIGKNSTVIIIGETMDLVDIHHELDDSLRYQLWITVKRDKPIVSDKNSFLPNEHFGALVYTKYNESLKHTKTRIQYTYCPACDKTTKDYGGKKHTYHHFGTLMSDVWRDISVDLDGDITPLLDRFSDLFGIEEYRMLYLYDLRQVLGTRYEVEVSLIDSSQDAENFEFPQNKPIDSNLLLTGDSLEILKSLPDNSVDFAFADPPYNLDKKYSNSSDDLAISEYFTWCDEWISELARVLRPGRTCAILNIPLWTIRHIQHMQKILKFQNWITWDALSFPVRQIMPAHYSIVCFTKSNPRPLPGLIGTSGKTKSEFVDKSFNSLAPLGEGFCLRRTCINKREKQGIDDTSTLTDIWSDIHRLKHNSRRVDHPCQLPPQLMYRLISIFTEPGELVLDCFNGAGTTTLAAHQLERNYIGIDISDKYTEIAIRRHEQISDGADPFGKSDDVPLSKNSRVERLPKQRYEVPKKKLQLEVRKVANELGHLPSREELIEHGRYPIKYYDEYFISWGEVCAAARTTGMSEDKNSESNSKSSQPRLF